MGFFSADLVGMIDIFQHETLEMLDEYDAHLLPAAQGEGMGPQDVQALFRVVHTLKSSAAMMGLEDMNRCAHHLEDAMVLLRDDPAKLSGSLDALLDVLYAFDDYVRSEMERLRAEDYLPADAAPLEKHIDSLLALLRHEAAAPQAAASERTWRLTFIPDCPMAAVRAVVLMKQAAARCVSLVTDPADLTAPGAETALQAHGLTLTITAQDPEDVRRRIAASPFVAALEDVLTPSETASPPREAPAAPAPVQSAAEPAAHAVRMASIPWTLVEHLQSLSGELTTSFMMLRSALERSGAAPALESLTNQCSHQLDELSHLAQTTSLLPVSGVVGQYYRTVRDICREEGKQAHLTVRGEELEVDRTLLDALATPLLHLFRNAVDHGMEPPAERLRLGKPETGCITLEVAASGDKVSFSVSDDGKGMDPERLLAAAEKRGLLDRPRSAYTADEALQLAFLPGFSTNGETTRYSGRGVGMDVVAKTVEELGGVTHVTSTPGQGTCITMEMPVSMTSCDALQFQVSGYKCLLPLRAVKHVLDHQAAAPLLRRADGRLWLKQEEALLPVLDLFDRFQAERPQDLRLVVLQGLRQDAAVLTGRIDGHLVVVEKPLPQLLRVRTRRGSGVSGCAVIGDGSLALMLDPETLIRMAGKGGGGA